MARNARRRHDRGTLDRASICLTREGAANESVRKIIDDIDSCCGLCRSSRKRGRVWTATQSSTGRHIIGCSPSRSSAPDLADALYDVESDPDCDPFANDVGKTLRALNERGMKIAVISDIHFDLRPVLEGLSTGVLRPPGGRIVERPDRRGEPIAQEQPAASHTPRRQIAATCELVDGRARDPEQLGDVTRGEDVGPSELASRWRGHLP